MPTPPDETTAPPLTKPRSFQLAALEPLRTPVFRLLWSTWFMANICMWMSDVASAWMMTTLTTSPIWVALVQTASTLPVFLLGLPSGALADILDRRRWLIATQFWLAGTAVVLCLAIAFDLMTAPLLLALTFANGIGLALRWPVFSAIVPELVARPLLPAAMGLNGISMNASRIIGPLLAGALIASAGTVWVFVFNAVLCVISGFVIMRWKREQPASALGRERLISAMRVGAQFVRQSPRLRAVLMRVFVAFLHSSSVMALLPLIARGLEGGDAGTFTVLLASMGSGAIVSVLCMPRLRQLWGRDQLVLRGTLLMSVATAGVALAPNVWLVLPGTFLCGVAWIAVANSLGVSAQLALPNWVRARGMSMYQMAIMGGSALGAALWGQVATVSTLTVSLLVASASGTLVMWLVLRYVKDGPGEDDLRPAEINWATGLMQQEPQESGEVVTQIEYLINPARARAFRVVMQQTRRMRLSEGAISWQLLHDVGNPERYVEHVVDESWTEHIRRYNRTTAADMALRERRVAFHQGAKPPVVTRFVVQR